MKPIAQLFLALVLFSGMRDINAKFSDFIAKNKKMTIGLGSATAIGIALIARKVLTKKSNQHNSPITSQSDQNAFKPEQASEKDPFDAIIEKQPKPEPRQAPLKEMQEVLKKFDEKYDWRNNSINEGDRDTISKALESENRFNNTLFVENKKTNHNFSIRKLDSSSFIKHEIIDRIQLKNCITDNKFKFLRLPQLYIHKEGEHDRYVIMQEDIRHQDPPRRIDLARIKELASLVEKTGLMPSRYYFDEEDNIVITWTNRYISLPAQAHVRLNKKCKSNYLYELLMQFDQFEREAVFPERQEIYKSIKGGYFMHDNEKYEIQLSRKWGNITAKVWLLSKEAKAWLEKQINYWKKLCEKSPIPDMTSKDYPLVANSKQSKEFDDPGIDSDVLKQAFEYEEKLAQKHKEVKQNLLNQSNKIERRHSIDEIPLEKEIQGKQRSLSVS